MGRWYLRVKKCRFLAKDKSLPSMGSAEAALSLQINTRHLDVVRCWLLSRDLSLVLVICLRSGLGPVDGRGCLPRELSSFFSPSHT